jgi:hypothetical protein
VTALFVNLTRGATYAVQAFALGAANEKSKVASSLVTMPPRCANVYPGAPQSLAPGLVGTDTITVTWARPASNPCLDAYDVTVQDVTGLAPGQSGPTVAG